MGGAPSCCESGNQDTSTEGVANLAIDEVSLPDDVEGIDAPHLRDGKGTPSKRRYRTPKELELDARRAAKHFQVVSLPGDPASSSEIGLALQRLSDKVGGGPTARGEAAARLVKKEWQHLTRVGSME